MKYPVLLDGFTRDALQMLEPPAGEEQPADRTDLWADQGAVERAFLVDLMTEAKNPHLARLLRRPDFPSLRALLMDEAAGGAPVPDDGSLLKALGVWVLRRPEDGRPAGERVLALAQALRRNGMPELARRLLLEKAWLKRETAPELFYALRNELALCTSVARDLAPWQRLEMAQELMGVAPIAGGGSTVAPVGDKSTELRCRAWIYRRRWEFRQQSSDLQLAAQQYLAAARLTQGALDRLSKTADAAYHFDLLQQVENDEPKQKAAADALRVEQLEIANTILQALLEEPADDWAQIRRLHEEAGIEEDPAHELLPCYRWLHNVAQLQAGLEATARELEKGKETEAAERARRLLGARQILWVLEQIGRMSHDPQADIPAWIRSRKMREIAERSKLWGTESRIARLFETGAGERKKNRRERQQIGRSLTVGKVGVGLSGGGFRASLFHLGVLASLAEWNLLRQVEVISSVSGGSIVAAHFYLKLRHLLTSRSDAEIDREAYVELVRELIHEFLAGVQKNIRTRVVASPWANLRMLLTHYTRSSRAGDLLDRHLFRQIPVPRSSAAGRWLLLSDLRIDPKGAAGDGFNPVRDNWQRQHKVPILILNATSLNTGHCWQFGATWMGESPAAIDPKVDSNDRLRRMDLLQEAPPPNDVLRLGQAVAASACVPGLFEPSTLPRLYQKKLVRLVDGGVFDNQGVSGLLEQECRIVLVSDASGQMSAQDQPRGGFLGSTMRSNTILMDRVRQTQYQDLRARRDSGQLDGLSYVHLKRDLEAGTVDWLGCDDPKPARRSDIVPSYGIPKPTQALLAAIRTDLDSFCDSEAYALMYSGYRMMTAECRRLSSSHSDLVSTERGGDRQRADGGADTGVDWPFLCVEERMTDPERKDARFASLLTVAGEGAFKIWRLWRRGRPAAKWIAGAVALLPAAWLAWLYVSAVAGIDRQEMLGVSKLVLALLPLVVAAFLLVPHLRELLARAMRLLVLGVLGMAASWIQLLVFDPLYLRYGREPAGFARRLLHEARRAAANEDPGKAQRRARRAEAILRRLLEPASPDGGGRGDSPWLSKVALGRALDLLGRNSEARSLFEQAAGDLAAATAETAEEGAQPWRQMLLARQAYVEQLKSALDDHDDDGERQPAAAASAA